MKVFSPNCLSKGGFDLDISVVNEIWLVAYSIGFGICVGIVYDLFRVSRLVFHLNSVFVFIEDLFFCLLVAVSYFVFCFIFNSGQIRLYVTAAAVLGWFLYYITVGRAVYYIIRKCGKGIKKLIFKIKNRKKAVKPA